jgi:hypothetical protein
MTATTDDRGADMLAELAEMDLSAAKHVHAQLLAATEASEVADLSRSYQRASRCLRQTLALKAKLTQDAVVHRIRTTPSPGTDWAAMQRELIHCDELGERISVLQDAVGRLLYTEVSDAGTRLDLTERFDIELDDWIEEPDFTTADVDAQVRRACRSLGLTEDHVAEWRTLPRPPTEADPDLEDDDVDAGQPGAAPPAADTG